MFVVRFQGCLWRCPAPSHMLIASVSGRVFFSVRLVGVFCSRAFVAVRDFINSPFIVGQARVFLLVVVPRLASREFFFWSLLRTEVHLSFVHSRFCQAPLVLVCICGWVWPSPCWWSLVSGGRLTPCRVVPLSFLAAFILSLGARVLGIFGFARFPGCVLRSAGGV